MRRVAQNADAVVGQSQNTIDNLNEYFTTKVRPELIPLGIPRPIPSKLTREQLGFDSSEVILITVGRLVARKGTDQLIRLIAAVNNGNVRS